MNNNRLKNAFTMNVLTPYLRNRESLSRGAIAEREVGVSSFDYMTDI